MKRLLVFGGLLLSVALSTGTAFAESIQNRFGVTGRLGFLIPADSDYNDRKLNADAGFVGGGGFIYGFDRNIALELDITHTWFGTELPSGPRQGDFSITNLAFGAQYRFMIADPKIVPYAGGGLDILFNEYERADVDTVVGIHASGGVDYFLTRDIALNAEGKIVIAPEADIDGAGGNFDPSSFSGTFGVRYFF
ncbi:outer membrane beta-barrel protein [Geobacter sp. DSM 9736]|uniref:outer membrane beta-barrel protein n=1 Tax=Geobacter sp. DSM 9736 TaxID=1277350 RepID=UPI000B504EA1|nr:outer membrane beta-barrel protein [Geobacter sp. DSM 9736]SNB47770.1 outer membrane protein [Geobacter sp. DSM 9736]